MTLKLSLLAFNLVVSSLVLTSVLGSDVGVDNLEPQSDGRDIERTNDMVEIECSNTNTVDVQAGDSFIIRSLNYPNRPPLDSSCNRRFRVPAGVALELNCSAFSSPCRFLNILVFNNRPYCTRGGLNRSVPVTINAPAASSQRVVNLFHNLFRGGRGGAGAGRGFDCVLSANGGDDNSNNDDDDSNNNDDSNNDDSTDNDSTDNNDSTDDGTTDGGNGDGGNSDGDSPNGSTALCGVKPNSLSRIVNGQESRPNDWPWAVFLTSNGAQCGASVISTRFVLTAAHCTENSRTNPAAIRVFVGCHRVTRDCEGVLRVRRNIIHENYNFPRNDIALLETATPITFTSKVAPVCLNSSPARSGRGVTAIGWGRTGGNQGTSQVLRQGNMRVASDAACARVYGRLPFGIVCSSAASATTCNGDSGGFVGATSLTNSNQWVQVGLVSFGVRGCPTTQLQGSTEVADFRSWITRFDQQAIWRQ